MSGAAEVGDAVSDVVVVGGGIVGWASAWRLARRGLTVQVVEPEPGRGASTVAAGMLAPVTEARLGEEALLALGLAALHAWGDFAAEVEAAAGQPVGYRSDGTVVVALDGDDRAALADLVDRQRTMGLSVEDLAGRELRVREPALAPGVRRGALAADECSVDPPALLAAVQAAARRAGVRSREEEAVGLEHSLEQVRGVVLADGTTVSAGTVVVAAGSWSPQVGLPGPVAEVLPVRPVKGQVLTLRQRPDDIVVSHTVRGYVRGSVVYMVPRRDGRLVCGATVEERGWDPLPTAGGAYELLRDVLALFPGLDEAELVQVRTGFRPGTPDDLPIVGRGPLGGLVLATGHYRNGILLAPVTADAVVSLVLGEEVPAVVAPCDPGRFGSREVTR